MMIERRSGFLWNRCQEDRKMCDERKSKMNTRNWLLAILVLAMTVGVWSCGGDDDTGSTGPVTITGAMVIY